MSETKNKSDLFLNDYEEIMKTSERTTIVEEQWSEEGDYFQKFSLYEDYTPVKTSGSTILNTQI
ncbi:hypothetical protein OQ279_03830 [Salinimicrobium sp. MT39]|uniref:Uncharacterized protein n=1 Tax=Salinimicrobium profundisediminis TaxID=2994553 RepID=A0A9X3CV54_9FLAO|nr:hypothetical protein [Salinimicrobium profundisediminis]MCX2837271.1 hypothetical protein [Salinimicrobium profundisediminis]